ncbi:MAG: ABC transporter substrate-binding protein [Alphaproteobacteria bacterium]|nr:ABC transporter substrate-binding protein [Alphaproteobacteria bacterium]
MQRRRTALLLAATLLAAAPGAVLAGTFRYAAPGDVLGLDPHGSNESMSHAMRGNIYEALVHRRPDLTLEPSLALSWSQPAPTVWRFDLRRGVRFHDGSPFTADDVVFSFGRVAHANAGMRTFAASIAAVRKIDDHTVEVVTGNPDPILLQNLASVLIMSRTWSEQHASEIPAPGAAAPIHANRHANGTGPFRLEEWVPDTRIVLLPNADWWGTPAHNLTRVEFQPIARSATRVAALVSGEVDMMYPVPPQDWALVGRAQGVRLLQGPELRTIFLGFDQARDELLHSGVKGRNPFKDIRVRRAFYQAIDVEQIARVVMRGAAVPTGLMIAPGIVGFEPELNRRYPFDPASARQLLEDAGYSNGFEVQLDCPNDRYVNDEAICLAVVPMLARIGVTVTPNAQTKARHFARIGLKENRNTSFYMSGWTPGTFDGHNALVNLMTMDGKGAGVANSGRYSNPLVEDLAKRIAVEPDPARRLALLHEAFRIHKEDFGHLPLHQQTLAWGVRDSVAEIAQRPFDDVDLRYVRMR